MDKKDGMEVPAVEEKVAKAAEVIKPVPKNITPPQATEISLLDNMNSETLLRGFVMSEILGPPKARKRREIGSWNSRF